MHDRKTHHARTVGRQLTGAPALAAGTLAIAGVFACSDDLARSTGPRPGALRPAQEVAARPTYTPPQAGTETVDGKTLPVFLLPKACDVLIGEAPPLGEGVEPSKFAHQLHVIVPSTGALVKFVSPAGKTAQEWGLPEGIGFDIMLKHTRTPNLNPEGEPDGTYTDAYVEDQAGTVFGCDGRDPQNPTYAVVEPATAHAGKGDGPSVNTDNVTLDLNGFGVRSHISAGDLLVPADPDPTSGDPFPSELDNIGISLGGTGQTLTNSSASAVALVTRFGHNIDVEAENVKVIGRTFANGTQNIETTGGLGVRLSSGTVEVAHVRSIDYSLEAGAAVGVGFEIRRCQAGSQANIHHSHFVGNGEGVLIRECSGVTVADNFISSPGGVGVNTREAVGTAARPVLIDHNQIDLQYPRRADVGAVGILWALGSDNLTIQRNTIKNFSKFNGDPTEVAPCGIQISSGQQTPDPAALVAPDGYANVITERPAVCGVSANQVPLASFTENCPDRSCTFTSTSTDPDVGGRVVRYEWNVGDGSAVKSTTTSTLAHTYTAEGTYSVTLVAIDDRGGRSAAVTRSVSAVTRPNANPTARFDFPATVASYTKAFTDQSTDPDGNATISKWEWSFGDGGTSTAQHPTYTYAQSGTYTVTLKVTDNRNGTHTQTASVTIGPVPISITQATGLTSNGSSRVDVRWSAASGAQVNIHRVSGAATASTPLGTPRVTTADDGQHTDPASKGTWSYKVCSVHDRVCSAWRSVTFR